MSLRFINLIALILLAGNLLLAQQTSIQGTVKDASGAVISGAVVRAVPTDGGATATTVTSDSGVYVLPTLRAAEYRVRAEVPGFTPTERVVRVLVGNALVSDFELQPASTTTTVDVIAEGVEIDVTSSQVGGNVDPQKMRDIPLNGRNWMELSLLVPGVTVNAVGNTPLGAQSSGRFQINVDGQQVTQNSAGTGFGQPQYSREAMAEFQIITNRFDATLGRSMQLQVNAQTRSGTNDFHGSAYGYFRNDRFNSADRVARRVLPFSNQQFGGTVGGPILKDKLWFFFSYEGERQPGTIFTTPLGFPGQSFEFDTKLTTNTYLTRADWQVNDNQRLSLRFNTFTFSNPFDGITGTAHPSRAVKRTRDSYGIFSNWSATLTPTLVNEVKVGFNRFSWSNIALVESQEYRLGGGITIGGPYNFPQEFNQNVQQYRNDLFWLKGGHTVKLGGEFLRNDHSGFFQQNVRGLANPFSAVPSDLPSIFPAWDNPAGWNIAALNPLVVGYVQGFGNFNIDIPRSVFGFWIQDDWKVSQKLVLNLGLRYDNDRGVFFTPDLASGVAPPRGGDNNNFSPRVGFAYDLKGDRKTVIRGGAGLYFADIQANQVINQSIFNGQTSLQVAVERRPGETIDLTDPFGGVSGEDFLSGAVPVAQQGIQILGRGAITPYSFQVSFGAERQLFKNWTVGGDFVHWRVYRDWIRLDDNLFYDPVTGYNVNPSTGGRPNPAFTSIQSFHTPHATGAIYDGVQMEVQRRFANRFTSSLAYTLSRTKDSTGGAFSFPNNQFDLADEWARSADDQRHTLNFSGSLALPWEIQTSMFYHLGSGNAFGVSVPGNPFNYTGTANRLIADTATLYIDSSKVSPARGVPGFRIVERNSFRGEAIHRVDFRVSKSFTFADRYRATGIAEAFNLFNVGNFGSYNTQVTSAAFGAPAQNLNLAYASRMLQFAVRFEF